MRAECGCKQTVDVHVSVLFTVFTVFIALLRLTV